MFEFTGERVVPGQVNADLWSEHVARYAFAARLASGKRVLDAGCGTGYGSAELARAAVFVTGLDLASDALEYARKTYPLPNTRFLAGSCTDLPFASHTFDLMVAFEVIEHLAAYSRFVQEAARVLTPAGLFVVSSPNKRYYAESREKTGPNPYHEHEFEPQEFHDELHRAFPHVLLLFQNRVESFAFHPIRTFWPAEARIDGGGGEADDAHFLIAICSSSPITDPRSFVYVPKAANLLREREQHVQLLERELEQSQLWLDETRNERDSLLNLYRAQKDELEARNRWAQQLNADLEASAQRISALQEELANEQAAAAVIVAGYDAKLLELEDENAVKTQWALDTEARLMQELQAKVGELAECVCLLETAEATVEERTLWAQRAEAQRETLARQIDLIRASRWLKLGRKLNLGPIISQP